MVFGLGVVIAVSVLAAAGVLSMVFVWRVLLAQGNADMKLKPKLRTPDTFILTMAA